MSDEQKCIYDLVKIVSESNGFITRLHGEIDKLQQSNEMYKKSVESQYMTLVQNNKIMTAERQKYDEFMHFLQTNFSEYFPEGDIPTDSDGGESDESDELMPYDTKSNTFISESGEMLVHKKMHPLDFAAYLLTKLNKSEDYGDDI